MEDILTSNVFGLLSYVQPQDGILEFLSFAEDKGGKPLKYLSSLSDAHHKSIEIDYTFWQRWKEPDRKGCEPDVVISLEIPDGDNLLILIEAKYLSGKSSEADEANEKPNDQLAKEWDYLSVRAGGLNKKPILIYLTKHYAYPHQEIEEAINDYKNKTPGATEPVIYWLSWRCLYNVCEDTNNPILKDLRRLLKRLNLKFFDGVKLGYVDIHWSYEKIFGWQKYIEIQTIKWRFES